MTNDVLLTVLIFSFAVLYSSVGHAGATGYQAAMALMGIAPPVMKISALVLNIPVALIGTYRFARAGHLPWKTLLPFAVASVPAAYVGGLITLPVAQFKQAIGVLLLLAASKLLFKPGTESTETTKRPPLYLSVPVGAGIGFLAGLTGTGGGVLLTPILLFMRWAKTREAAGVSVGFILLNSLSGLAGQRHAFAYLPSTIWIWVIAVVVGGLIGTQLGTRRLDIPSLRRLLGIVLIIAGAKMVLETATSKLNPPAGTSSANPVSKI